MKTIGFRKEHDARIIIDEYIDKVSAGSVIIDDNERVKIIKYLEKGVMIFSMTLWLTDGATNIGPYIIYTDGVWIWPSHFVYYIRKGDYGNLNQDFVSYMREVDYIPQKEAKMFLFSNMLKLK
ncbi:hypothetical protein GC194_10965 [bacterium]|nr:hypothetical protein [bacterium]